MKKSKFKIIFSLTMIIIFLFNIIPINKVQASDSLSWDSIVGTAKGWIDKGKGMKTLDGDAITQEIIPLGQMLMGIGVAVLVICATVMGIQYLTASPDKQGKIKQQAIGLLVAAVVIFGAWGIWSLVYNFMNDITA